MRHPGVPQKLKMGPREMNSKMVVVVVGPSLRSGRYEFGAFGAQDCVLRDRCSVGTRHAFFSITLLSI